VRKPLVVAVAVCIAALSGCALFQPPKDTTLYDEKFSDPNTTAWSLGESDTRKKWIEGGQYHILVKKATSTWSWNSTEGPFDNFQVDLDVTHIQGPNDQSAAGLVFRLVDGNNAYFFRISPAGTYYVGKWVAGAWTAIKDWTNSSAINTGAATNHLTVIADGTSLTFRINDQEVTVETDTSYAGGRVGVLATAYSDDNDVHVSFDNLIVHSLE
jgi:hypothetical protein